MYKFLLFLSAIFSFGISKAQTFNGTGGAIPDNGSSPTCFPINVTGVGAINGTYGLASVCVTINHTYDGDLNIKLVAPNGVIIPLSTGNGTTGDNYNGTCFNETAATNIANGTAPFAGTYIPEGNLGAANNGQNADGAWTLCVQDIFPTEIGNLVSWSITFSSTPATPVPACIGNPPAGNTCTLATPVCNFDGYCGNTSADYTIDTWPELTTAFCGAINNNSFVTFVASATTATFDVFVSNSRDGTGIQMMFYDGGCGSGAVNDYGCYQQITPEPTAQTISAAGLIPGNTYYLMIDGFNGDVCDYTISAVSGVNILNITPNDPTICPGQSIVLTAAGGNGVYTWSGPNLSATSGTSVTATPAVTSTYSVTSINPVGSCPITTEITVTISNTTAPPTVSTPVTYCQGATATPLTATGTGILWYIAASGGTGSATAPTPSTATIGSTTYYVSQTVAACGESERIPVVVNIVAVPPAPTVTSSVGYCQGAASTALTATGTGLLWYTSATAGIGTTTAPTPSTATTGTTIYYVSQTIAVCEGPRAVITVTVTSTPVAPIVSSPVSYCQNATAAALSATGTNLLWYTTPTGGTGSASAPTPSTTTVGTNTWYVSQANGTCRGPRATIVVNIAVSTPAPGTTDITYCQGAIAAPLTAVGTSLLWYVAATGGSGSATAPTPSTATIGSTTYYVTQTLSCGESPRQSLVVNITTTPIAPAVTTPVRYCIGSTASALTATGTSLLWYTTATGGSGSSTAPIPSTATVGSTIYYVSQSTGTCEGPRASITVTVNSIPSAPTAMPNPGCDPTNPVCPVTYCLGASSVALTAIGTGLLWYTTATGGTGSATAPIPSTATVGSTIYYVSQTINNCESPRAEITVTILPSTVLPTATTPVGYCQGTSASALTATGTGLLWYTAATGGTGSATAPTPSTATAGSTTYYVSQTTAPCGESARLPIVVNINTTPAAPVVSSPVVYCQNTTAPALTATGTSLLWYTVPSGGSGSSTAPTPSTATVGSTTYYVSQSLGTCEGPRATITVTINSIPVAPGVTPTYTYCQNTTAPTLTATGVNLLWYTTATGGAGNTAAPTPSTAVPGNFNYYVSQTINSCEGPRAQISITILPSTVLPTATTPVSYCQGNSAVALVATGTTLLWYTTATGGTGSITAPTPSTATAGSTTYYVSQNVAPCGESGRLPIVVNINPTPGAPVVSSPVIYCQNTAAVALAATGTSLLWYTSATGGTGSTTAPVPSTSSVGNTIYYVSQSLGICEGPRAAITVTVNSTPAAPGVTPTYTYCQNVTAPTLTATGNGLQWYTTATGGTGTTIAPTPPTSAPGNSSYYVSQTINSCEGPRAEIVITILSSTALPTATSPVSYCQGSTSSALTATGTSLLWYSSATGGTGTSAAPIPSTTTVGSTTYYVSQKIAPCGESGRLPVVVNVSLTPAAPVVGGPINYCQDAIAPPLSATGTDLLWYATPSGGIGSTTAPDQYTTVVGTTTYYVSQSIGACEGPRASIVVNINPYPNFGPDLRDTVCAGDSVNLTVKFNTAGYTANWTLNDAPVPNPSAVKVSGVYQLEAINSVGCPDTVLVYVTIQPLVAAFAGNDTIAIKGVPHQLSASGGIAYEWRPINPLSLPKIQNPMATLDHDQQFEVIVTDAAGCVGTDKIFIQVYDGPTYYVPNAFSPNNDGLNDVFRVIPVGISRTDWFRVFNRFGQLVFESNKWLKGWDGTFLGKKQPAGNYVWIIKGIDKYGKVVEMKGTVMIVQ